MEETRGSVDMPGGGSGTERDAIAGRFRSTRLERAIEWAAGLAPAPLVVASSCCGMALADAGDLFEALGSAPAAVSPREADLLIVAGSVTRRQAPLLREIYERLLEPRWVMAWGVCAASGGPYRNYATLEGLHALLPVDVTVLGCPPEPADFREALNRLREGRGATRTAASSETGPRPIREVVG